AGGPSTVPSTDQLTFKHRAVSYVCKNFASSDMKVLPGGTRLNVRDRPAGNLACNLEQPPHCNCDRHGLKLTPPLLEPPRIFSRAQIL
ncbi:hypothetical protein PCASD_14521, partial [Puccinia coronata f. sp. avenae]